MKVIPSSRSSKALTFAVAVAFAAGTALAQSPASTQTAQQSSAAQNGQDNGWKKFNGGWTGSSTSQNATPSAQANSGPSPTAAVQVTQGQDASQDPNQSPDSQQPGDAPPSNAPAIRPYSYNNGRAFPPPLSIPQGTVLTVRINQALSSDHNHVGDIFAATLTQPVIVHGIVVAQAGQSVVGRVVQAKKAGMVSGVSELGIQLTSLTLADGQNVPVESQLLVTKGPTSKGRDAAAIAGTTGFGAAVGAAAGWGTGAAIGAGAGFVASTIGVLLTRGYPTVVYPETLLSFQTTSAVPVDTDYAPQAFHAVTAADYQAQQQAPQQQQQGPPPQSTVPPQGYGYPAPAYPNPYYVYGPPYYPYPYYYPYYGYPYGVGFNFVFGYPGYYHGYYPHYYYGGHPYPYRGGVVHSSGGGFHGGGGGMHGGGHR